LSGQGFWSGQVDTITKKLDQIGNSLDKLETEEKMQALAAEIVDLDRQVNDQKQQQPLSLADTNATIERLQQAVNGLPDQAVAGVRVAKAELQKIEDAVAALEAADQLKVSPILEQIRVIENEQRQPLEHKNYKGAIAALDGQIAQAEATIAKLTTDIAAAEPNLRSTQSVEALGESLQRLQEISRALGSLKQAVAEIKQLRIEIEQLNALQFPPNQGPPAYAKLHDELNQLQNSLQQIGDANPSIAVTVGEAQAVLGHNSRYLQRLKHSDDEKLSEFESRIQAMEDNPEIVSMSLINQLTKEITDFSATARFRETQDELGKLNTRLDAVQAALNANLQPLRALEQEMQELENFLQKYEKGGTGRQDRQDQEELPRYEEQLKKVRNLFTALNELKLSPEDKEEAYLRKDNLEQRLLTLKKGDEAISRSTSSNKNLLKQVTDMMKVNAPNIQNVEALRQEMRRTVVFKETYDQLRPAIGLENTIKWHTTLEEARTKLNEISASMTAAPNPPVSYQTLDKDLTEIEEKLSKIADQFPAKTQVQAGFEDLRAAVKRLHTAENETLSLLSKRVTAMAQPGFIIQTQNDIDQLRQEINTAKGHALLEETRGKLDAQLEHLAAVEETFKASDGKLAALTDKIQALKSSLDEWEQQPLDRKDDDEIPEYQTQLDTVAGLEVELKQLPLSARDAALADLETVKTRLQTLNQRDKLRLEDCLSEISRIRKLADPPSPADIQGLRDKIKHMKENTVFKETYESLALLNLANEVARLEESWKNVQAVIGEASTDIQKIHQEIDTRANAPAAGQEPNLPVYQTLKSRLGDLGKQLEEVQLEGATTATRELLQSADQYLEEAKKEDDDIVFKLSGRLDGMKQNPTQAGINNLKADITTAMSRVNFKESQEQLKNQLDYLDTTIQNNFQAQLVSLSSDIQELQEKIQEIVGEKKEEVSKKELSDFPSCKKLKNEIADLRTKLQKLAGPDLPQNPALQSKLEQLNEVEKNLKEKFEEDREKGKKLLNNTQFSSNREAMKQEIKDALRKLTFEEVFLSTNKSFVDMGQGWGFRIDNKNNSGTSQQQPGMNNMGITGQLGGLPSAMNQVQQQQQQLQQQQPIVAQAFGAPPPPSSQPSAGLGMGKPPS
jgi:DNA repair exonuclease SbcCD ATPase subunit